MPYNPQIQKTCRKLVKTTKQKKQALKMEENNNQNHEPNVRVLHDFCMPVDGTQTSIARPAVNTNKFELKFELIQIVQ